jgi:hypothetical protein
MKLGISKINSGGYRLKQNVRFDEIDSYIVTKKGISTIPEDSLDYLDFNCAYRVPFLFQNFSVLFISNDASYNHFSSDPKELLNHDPEELQNLNEKLYSMRRLQVFKRISHRAGLASYNTSKKIRENHKQLITDIYLQIQQHFPEVKAPEIQKFLKNCQGIKFSKFDQLANPQSGDDMSNNNPQKTSKTPRHMTVTSQLDMNSPRSQNTKSTLAHPYRPHAKSPSNNKPDRPQLAPQPTIETETEGTLRSPGKQNFAGQLTSKEASGLREPTLPSARKKDAQQIKINELLSRHPDANQLEKQKLSEELKSQYLAKNGSQNLIRDSHVVGQ